MIRYGTWLTAAVAGAFLAGAGSAADPTEMIAESGAMEIVLLRQPAVQKDLHLTEVNTKKISDFAAEQWKKAKEIHQMPANEQDVKWNMLAHENDVFLSKVLTPEQAQRLNQIGMQVAGLLWAGRPDVQSALMLTPEQKKKLDELHKEARHDAMAIMKTPGGVKPEEMKKLHERNKELLIALLTPQQREKWKVLSGPEFKGELQFLSKKD